MVNCGPVKIKAWLVVVLLLVPGAAAGESVINPAATTTWPLIEGTRQTPPPPTIRAAPEELPWPLVPTGRSVKVFGFRPILEASEEYSDNFNRSSENPISNFRSTISPGGQISFDTGFLTGRAAYTLSAFHDSSADQMGIHHLFACDFAWQATPRLKFILGDTFTKSDDPAQADRLNLRLGRQDFTSNVLSLGSAYSLSLIETTQYYRLSTFSSTEERTTSHTLGATVLIPLGRIHTVTLGYEYLKSETTVDPRVTVVIPGTGTPSTTTGHQLTGSFSRDLTKNTTAGVAAAYAVREQTQATGRTNFSRWSLSLFNNYVLADRIVMHGSMGLAQLDSPGSSARLLLTSNTDIAYYIGPAVLGLKVERGFSESFAEGQNFGVVETSGVVGSVFYRFSPLLTGSATGGYRENIFTGVGGGQEGREDRTVTVTANLSYQVRRWLTATVDYTYSQTKASALQPGFVENRFRATLNASID